MFLFWSLFSFMAWRSQRLAMQTRLYLQTPAISMDWSEFPCYFGSPPSSPFHGFDGKGKKSVNIHAPGQGHAQGIDACHRHYMNVYAFAIC